VRVACFRGAGGQAFVAGTDIAQFQSFSGGDSGIAYERGIDAGIALLESLPMPTVAVVEGWAVGGGHGDRHGLRLPHRHAGSEVRRADRAHAGQLPVDGQRRAPGGALRPAAGAALLLLAD
jgi:hypothetical protein